MIELTYINLNDFLSRSINVGREGEVLDQSFSPGNLVKIYHGENKKGINVAGMFLPQVLEEYKKINRMRALIRKLFLNRRIYRRSTFKGRVVKLYEMKRNYKRIKNEKIVFYMEDVSKVIGSKHFSFKVDKLPYKKNGKDVYRTGSDAASFFAEKQIQRNIKRTYSVKQADRDIIVPQLISILSDKVPKLVMKADIEAFYESIDRDLLVKKLNEKPVLSLSTRKLITKMFRKYEALSGEERGIPRGIGISAYLAELYLKTFDEEIKRIDNLIYYARYVDDIVIVVSIKSGEGEEAIKKKVSSLLDKEKLSLNQNKTDVFSCLNGSETFSFEYLGYKFNKAGAELKVSISDKKIEKYKSRISRSIDKFKKNSIKQPKKAKKELFLRLSFLTTNTSLSNNKGNAVVGVYNTNKWITETGPLVHLDNILKGRIASLKDEKIKQKASKFSFRKGFSERRYTRFTSKDLETIVKAWKQ